MSKSKSQETNEVTIIKSDDLGISYFDGAYAGMTPQFGQLFFYIDTPDFKANGENQLSTEGTKRKILLDIRMHPDTFIGIAETMARHAEIYKKYRVRDIISDQENID